MEKKVNPVIILPGINHSPTFLYDENDKQMFDSSGNPIGGSLLFPDTRAAKEKFTSLLKKLATVAFIQNADFVYERAYDVGCAAFAPQRCNMSGDHVNNLKTKRWNYPVSEMLQEDKDWVYLMVPMQKVTAITGEENFYFFTFNLVGDPMKSADELDEFIDMVKEQRGCDKVSLLPVSLGGTILTAYLDAYGHDKIDKIINIVACLDGSPVAADIYAHNFNVSAEYLHHDFLAEIIKEEKGRGTLGYIINTLLHLLPEEAFNLALKGLVNSVLDTIMINCPQFWAMVPSYRYDELAVKYLGDAAHSALKARTDRFQQARLNLRDNLLKAAEDGVIINSISGSNLNLGEKMYTFLGCVNSAKKYNSDGVINLSSTTLGATGAADGAVLPEGYKQATESPSYPGYSYISPDGKIDVSTAVLPDNTWIFLDQYHEVGRNDSVLNLAKALILGDIENVHSDPENYPQFNRFCNTYELRRRKLPAMLKIMDEIASGSFQCSETRKAEFQSIIDEAQAVLNLTIGDDKRAQSVCKAIDDTLIRLGRIAPKESDSRREEFFEKFSEMMSRSTLRHLGGGNIIDKIRKKLG